jgi:hypothetical protein
MTGVAVKSICLPPPSFDRALRVPRNSAAPSAFETNRGRPLGPKQEADDEDAKYDRDDDGDQCRVDPEHGSPKDSGNLLAAPIVTATRTGASG